MAANSGCLNLSWTGTSEPAVRDRCHPKVPELSALSKLIEPTAIPDVYVIVRRRDQVLLLLRSGPGYKDGEWGPPSGKVEPGESYGDAAARELHEETGISVSPTDLRLLCVLDRIPDLDNRWIGVFFELRDDVAVPVNLETDKHSAIEFFSVSALPAHTIDYVRHVLVESARGANYLEWRFS